jgi:hypothetical protein
MPAFKSIGRMTRDREEKDCWHKLRQPDITKIEGTLCDFVNLPSDGDCLHLDRRDDQKARDLKQDESRMGKSGASSPGVGVR